MRLGILWRMPNVWAARMTPIEGLLGAFLRSFSVNVIGSIKCVELR
jgi:hypothetical protein